MLILEISGYLHFSYYGVLINLLRRLIRSTALPPSCPESQVLLDLRQLALQTAQSAISFVMQLRSDQLEAFWYFSESKLCSHRHFSLIANTRRSFTLSLLLTWVIHHPPARHVPFISREKLLARDTQLVPVVSANDEQEQRADEIRREPPGRGYPAWARTYSCRQS